MVFDRESYNHYAGMNRVPLDNLALEFTPRDIAPEPATCTLSLTGLAAPALQRRRRSA